MKIETSIFAGIASLLVPLLDFDALTERTLFANALDRHRTEYGNPEGAHPEVVARREALAKAFSSDKLQIKKLPEIAEDATKIGVLHTWLHEKAKKVDKGFGVGRFVADPKPADETEDDDGMGV